MDAVSENVAGADRWGEDLWNASLCKGAEWTANGLPKVRTTASALPSKMIAWPEAKRLHRMNIAAGNHLYRIHAFIHCYVDDQKFDGKRTSIWTHPGFFYEVASHFDGITGIDFSTYADMLAPLRDYQFYRMRTIEHGAILSDIPLIPNARWGTSATWESDFAPLPEHSPLSIGTVGSGLRRLENRPVFDAGIKELIRLKQPTVLVIYGSARYPIFDEIRSAGIEVLQFDSATAIRFKRLGAAHV